MACSRGALFLCYGSAMPYEPGRSSIPFSLAVRIWVGGVLPVIAVIAFVRGIL